jgi:hypothetical protein
MNVRFTLGAILGVTIVTTPVISLIMQQADAVTIPILAKRAPPAISGENVYVAWWTNNTADSNEEVMFRASTDGGATFGDKINLINITDADSTRAEIDSDADSLVVTRWGTNQTHDTPMARISTDNGATFGPVLILAINGTIGEAEGTEEGE